MIEKLSEATNFETCRSIISKVNELVDIVNNHSCLNETFINCINVLNGERYEESKRFMCQCIHFNICPKAGITSSNARACFGEMIGLCKNYLPENRIIK